MNPTTKWLLDHLKTDEGKQSIRDFAKKLMKQREHRDRWVEKIHKHYGNNIDFLTEKLMDKYYDDDYIRKEHARGFEPREPLIWILWEYAIEHGTKCDDKEYLNAFTGEAYYLGTHVIQIMHGQGSVIRIDKIQ